jgi:hypothetical protein
VNLGSMRICLPSGRSPYGGCLLCETVKNGFTILRADRAGSVLTYVNGFGRARTALVTPLATSC